MEIQIYLKSNYGKEQIYPFCEKGQKLARLLNCKTFTESQISQLRSLDYTFAEYTVKGHFIGNY